VTDELAVTPDLTDVRQRRKRLAAQMHEVEAVLAAPLAGRESAWSEAASAALEALDDVLVRHITDTERPDGLLASVRAENPTLDPQIRRLETEHGTLRTALHAARAQLAAAGVDADLLCAARSAGTDLLGAIARHRQRGADLLYQAYNVDLGGSG
jgi:hypothetical protein